MGVWESWDAVEKGQLRRAMWFLIALFAFSIIGLVPGDGYSGQARYNNGNVIKSEKGVVAADHGHCSEIGASMLRKGGHAVDAAVATALCLGVVNPSSSGIGGGGFMIVWSSPISQAEAFDMRETAPAAASQNMYENDPKAKASGARSMGVPGELAGLREVWKRHGRLAWRTLIKPAIKLAKDGFVVTSLLGSRLASHRESIMADPGLREMFAPAGVLLKAGDTCYNVRLGHTLQTITEQGARALYNGTVGEKFVQDVREVGGILTMEDLRNYRVRVTNAMGVNVMGHTIFGMPPPSSGTVGISLVMNILESYGSLKAVEGGLGLHRLIEAIKHMLAVRMNLGDPEFVDIREYVADMLSPSFAEHLRKKILDNTTFPPDYYMNRWNQVIDDGTSHFCIVDGDRNAVSMTTTVNSQFGAGILSRSSGILLNNEMDDFSTPAEQSPNKLPPAPANFIEPNKRPLSSMTPIIVMKDGQLTGVIGASGGLHIIAAVSQVFLNHFVLGMEPAAAVHRARVYHKLIPNIVQYENWTMSNGDHFELPEKSKLFLQQRGHWVGATGLESVCQLVVQTIWQRVKMGRKAGQAYRSSHGMLTAISDPRKGGSPAAI